MLSGGALFSKISSKTGFTGSFSGSYPILQDFDLLAGFSYLSERSYHGAAADLQFGINVPLSRKFKFNFAAGGSYLHLKNTTYPFSFTYGVSYSLNKRSDVALYNVMRYKPGSGILTQQVMLGLSIKFGNLEDNLIGSDKPLPYQQLQESHKARVMVLRKVLCSDLSCDGSRKIVTSSDFGLLKKHKMQLVNFLNLTDYRLKLIVLKNNKIATSLFQANNIKGYFVNSEGIAQDRVIVA